MSKAVTEGMAVGIAVDMAEATEEVLGAIMGDTLTATPMAMAIAADTDTVGGVILIGGVMGGALLTGGVILTAGVTLTGGVTLTIPLMAPTMILITVLIPTKAMEGRWCLQKELLPRRNRNSYHLIGTFVRTQRVTILM